MYRYTLKALESVMSPDGLATLRKFFGTEAVEDKPLTWAAVVSALGGAEGKDAADVFRMLGEVAGVVEMSPQEAQAWELFAVRCARHVQGDMVDERSLKALNIREHFIMGLASKEEMEFALEGAKAAVKALAGDWRKETAASIAQDVAGGLPASFIVHRCKIYMEYTPGPYGGMEVIPVALLKDFAATCGVARKENSRSPLQEKERLYGKNSESNSTSKNGRRMVHAARQTGPRAGDATRAKQRRGGR